MKAIFADTYYFLGLLNRGDEAHVRCAAFAKQFHGTLITTAYVLVEVADGLASPRYRLQTAKFIETLQTLAQVRIVSASESLLSRALQFYAEHSDKEWSLTDCISFLVMADENIQEALTGDHHFQQAGFVALFASTS